MEILKKENILIAVAIVCVIIYFNRQSLHRNELARKTFSALPIIGGLAFGFNTLIQITK